MEAWAYIDGDGNIDIDTVSSTPRAAKVNAIVTGSFRNVVPNALATDIEIETMFLNVSGGIGSIRPVRIIPVEDG